MDRPNLLHQFVLIFLLDQMDLGLPVDLVHLLDLKDLNDQLLQWDH